MYTVKKIVFFCVSLYWSFFLQIVPSYGEEIVPKQLIIGCPFHVLEPPSVRVFLTVSSLIHSGEPTIQRQLELNWYNVNPIDNDWVGLFIYDPRDNWTQPIERASPVDHPSGWFRTSVSLPYYTFNDPTSNITDLEIGLTNSCLDFWIAYIRDKSVLATDCLKIRPNWMWETRETIGEFALHELLIPGTHNSGSYQEYEGKKSDNVITRYKICQDENIWNQLVFGIRHFDFRVSFYKNNPQERFWFNHDFVKINPFSTAIAQIKTFINSTREVIILDFHRFPVGFKNRVDRHRKLIAFLRREIGEYMIPRSFGYDTKLNKLWETNKRILVTYNSPHYQESELLWRGLTQIWAATNKANQLRHYFEDYMQAPTALLWSAMAELTPTLWNLMSNPTGSLRKLADKVNRNVTHWFRDLWWDRANVVATDYFLGNNMIEVAIEVNRRRKLCRDLVFSRISVGEPTTTAMTTVDSSENYAT